MRLRHCHCLAASAPAPGTCGPGVAAAGRGRSCRLGGVALQSPTTIASGPARGHMRLRAKSRSRIGSRRRPTDTRTSAHVRRGFTRSTDLLAEKREPKKTPADRSQEAAGETEWGEDAVKCAGRPARRQPDHTCRLGEEQLFQNCALRDYGSRSQSSAVALGKAGERGEVRYLCLADSLGPPMITLMEIIISS